MKTRERQRGYLLLTVVVTLFLLSAIAMLLAHDSASNARNASSELEAARAHHLAQAGMQNALWRAQNNACLGDLTIPATPLGPDSYSATITGAPAGSLRVIDADGDAWIRSDDTDKNNGTSAANHVRYESGKIEQVLTRFDLSSIAANAQINSAIAWFHLKAGKSHPEGMITVHAITADWDEATVTWDSFAGAYRQEFIGTIPAQDEGDVWVAVNLTGLVQSWVNGQPNNGILFNSEAEGLHTEYTAREDGANPPRLEVVVGSGDASTIAIEASGTLGNGVGRTLLDSGAVAYQPTTTEVIQPGAEGKDAWVDASQTTDNFGATREMTISGGASPEHFLIQFPLDGIPDGTRVVSARMELYLNYMSSADPAGAFSVHRMTEPWIEGTGDNWNPGNGASWNTSDGSDTWSWQTNHDFNVAVDETIVDPSFSGWHAWDITSLVQEWTADERPNRGVVVKGNDSVSDAWFRSSDYSDPANHPRLIVEYACRCGTPCMTPRGSGRVMLVNGSAFFPSSDDRAKRELFESWGYDVDYYDDDTWQSFFNLGFGYYDVVFVAGSSSAAKLGDKLTNAPIGVVSEKGELNDNFGFASAYANPVGESISVNDSSHYITSIFSGGTVDIYRHAMRQLTASGTTSAGAQVLATIGGADALVALDSGAAMQGGGTTTGRRVMLPSNENLVSWDYFTDDGLLIVQRSLAWSMNADAVSVGNLLLVAGNASDPSGNDEDRMKLFESWGYTVTLIDDGADKTTWQNEMTDADVVYVSDSVSASTTLADILTTIGKPLVNEDRYLIADLGFAESEGKSATADTLATDPGYLIAEPLAGADATIFTSGLAMPALVGRTSDDLRHVAGVTGTATMMAALNEGDRGWNGALIQSPRVHVPFAVAAVNDLTSEGQLLLRRAIEWALDPVKLFVAHYKLDEGTGLTASDSQSGHDGTLTNGPAWAAGTLGDAVAFSEPEHAVIAPHHPHLEITQRLTLAAWVNADELLPNRVIVRKGGDNTNHTFYLGMYDDKIIFATSPQEGGWNAFPSDTTSIQTGDWHHVAATFDNATDTVRFYFDGAPAGERTTSIEPGTWAGDVIVGRNDVNYAWRGRLDDVRIYRRVLSAAEINALGSRPPIAHWMFDESTGSTATDSAGGHHGFLDEEPGWVSGKIDGAIELNDSEEYVEVPHDDALSLTNRMSFSSWIYPASITSRYRTILAKDAGGSDSNYWFGTWAGELVFGFWANGYFREVAAASAGIPSNAWTHVAVTFDASTDTVQLYVNGTVARIGSLTHDPVSVNANLQIGRSPDGEHWYGRLDDVRIYDRLLSDEEIATLGASDSVGGGGGGCPGTFRDEFNARSFSGDDGTLSWTGDWLEVGESDGPQSGDIQVRPDTGNYQLRTRDNDNGGEGLMRTVNLTGAGSATLTWNFRRMNLDRSSDYTAVEVSSAGRNGPWTELARHSGSNNDSVYQGARADLTPHISATTTIRLKTSSTMGGTDTVWFDNIEIDCRP